MKLAFNYGNSVAVLPVSALNKLDKATKKDIKLLFVLSTLGRETFDTGNGKFLKTLAERSGLGNEDIESSLAFWRGAGVLEDISSGDTVSEDKKVEVKKSEKKNPERSAEKKKLKSADELPRYSTDELAMLLEKRSECRLLIDECQQLFGKIFTTAEVNLLVGLTDYLGLDGDYILLLFSYCGKMEHKSVRTVEKYAHKFLDEGINDAVTLSEHIQFLEEADKLEVKVRKLFGITSRSLTKKERAFLQKWLGEYNYGFDIIEKAYELTVDSTGKMSFPYTGAIMDRWHSLGVASVEDIEKDVADYKKNKASEGSSFDTDEFIEAALQRSYGKK
ncbi:MAG: DnaD domain protein [Clostridia bacterium]|nr:DnaD domain protein [Clostridia bacterium]